MTDDTSNLSAPRAGRAAKAGLELVKNGESPPEADALRWPKEDLLIGKGVGVNKERSPSHSENGRDECARLECSVH